MWCTLPSLWPIFTQHAPMRHCSGLAKCLLPCFQITSTPVWRLGAHTQNTFSFFCSHFPFLVARWTGTSSAQEQCSCLQRCVTGGGACLHWYRVGSTAAGGPLLTLLLSLPASLLSSGHGMVLAACQQWVWGLNLIANCFSWFKVIPVNISWPFLFHNFCLPLQLLNFPFSHPLPCSEDKLTKYQNCSHSSQNHPSGADIIPSLNIVSMATFILFLARMLGQCDSNTAIEEAGPLRLYKPEVG